ncbi:MAG: hypothetical protein AB7E80_08235 [Hyphomicrobiaceae bacterium]
MLGTHARILTLVQASVLAIVLALMGAELQSAAAAPEMPQAEVQSSGRQIVDIDNIDDETLANAMARYIMNVYLSSEPLTPEEIEQIYAPVVSYFGQPRKTRRSIILDKLAYYRRWPFRHYDLVPDSMQIERFAGGSDKMIDVSFDFTFDVSSGGRTSRGRGKALLSFDFSLPGGQIVREESRVTRRFR